MGAWVNPEHEMSLPVIELERNGLAAGSFV